VNDLRNALAGDVPVARQILRKLLRGEKIVLEPAGSGKERSYKFSGKLALGGLLIGGSAGSPASTEARTMVVAPTGRAGAAEGCA